VEASLNAPFSVGADRLVRPEVVGLGFVLVVVGGGGDKTISEAIVMDSAHILAVGLADHYEDVERGDSNKPQRKRSTRQESLLILEVEVPWLPHLLARRLVEVHAVQVVCFAA